MLSNDIILIPTPQDSAWKTLVEFTLPSHRNSNHSAQEQVVAVAHKLNLSAGNLERLKTAIAEAMLSAANWPELPVFIRVLVSEQVRPGQTTHQEREPTPYLQRSTAKVTKQPARQGWGFFLIHKIETEGEACYRIELFLYREEASR